MGTEATMASAEWEWLSTRHMQTMLVHLHGRSSAVRITHRKRRLFALACCQRVDEVMGSDALRPFVEHVEALADARRERLDAEAMRARLREVRGIAYEPWDAVFALLSRRPSLDVVSQLCRQAAIRGGRVAEGAAQCRLMRCLFGNPFRPVAFALAWRSGDAVELAGVIYAGREWARMPILGDALEEAGCDSADVLDHCRAGGEHARGCWVVDHILGPEDVARGVKIRRRGGRG